MDLKIHVTVHAYAEEELRDEVLVPHSGNYGILGKEIVAPLRRINGKSFSIKNVEADFSITNLWDWIDKRIYEIGAKFKTDSVLTLADEFSVIQKYLMFNGLRYSIGATEKPIAYFLHRMGHAIEDTIEIQLLLCMDAGSVFEDDGIRYYMNSRETGNTMKRTSMWIYGTKHQDHFLSSQERNCQRGKLGPLMCVRFK